MVVSRAGLTRQGIVPVVVGVYNCTRIAGPVGQVLGAKMAAEQHIASVVECLQRIATAETEGEPCAQVLPCLSAMPVTVPPVPLRVWTPRTFDSSACVCVGHRPSATFAEIKSDKDLKSSVPAGKLVKALEAARKAKKVSWESDVLVGGVLIMLVPADAEEGVPPDDPNTSMVRRTPLHTAVRMAAISLAADCGR